MKKIADYVLLERLGSGNHGVFYLARTPQRLNLPDTFCAVKILSQRASSDAFRRMANELQIFASINSANLVSLFDAGHQDGVLYYATAYHEKGSLASPRNAGLDPRGVVSAVADAARGAHALHEVGVAHRDIKPGNVLLTDRGAVLSDLGLAQLLSRGATLTGLGPIGTLAFMEPGVARGDESCRASDVWSLAATLLAALTGHGPFPGLPTENLGMALQHLLREEPQIPGELDPTLRRLIEAGLQRDRAARPRTALEYAEMLHDWSGHAT
ncbi:serine/threonine-protein kinase [Mycolicibacterium hippocampi]|uniref:serine/threonine-protein kinase n=1 Tax=Mycolicibacterium hippocampi TaxID=659824 RepID=UPI00351452AF